MTYVVPIPLPEAVLARDVDPKTDFGHLHHAIAWTSDGAALVHSSMFYNFFRYGDTSGREDVSATIVTRLDPGYSITGLAWLEDLHREMTHVNGAFSFNDEIAALGITAHDEVVFATAKQATFVYDAALEHRLATFDPRVAGGTAGVSALVGVSGGLVALRGDTICVATGAPALRAGIPELRAIATREVATFAGLRGYHGRLVALDSDHILVSAFVGLSRSNHRSAGAFELSILRGDGAVTRLPLGAADTPYGKVMHDESFAAHRGLGVFLIRSQDGLHGFDRDGQRVLRLAFAEDNRFDAIAPLGLLGVSPRGELVMVHRKHHLLVITDPVTAIDQLESVLAEAGAVYKSEHARLKKAVHVVDNRWFGWEPTTPRAAAKVVKAKHTPGVAPVAPAPATPEPIAGSPREAMIAAPADLDTLAVYADSLADTEPALSEYIQIGVRLERPDNRDPIARAALIDRREALRAEHMRAWLQRWNDPNPLFEARFHDFAGLPQSVRFDAMPRALDKLEAQLAQLPIRCFAVSGIGTKGIQQLATVPAMRRISKLIITKTSKLTLGKQFVAWLAAQRYDNIRELILYGVELTGAGMRALVESMPRLATMRLSDAKLTAEAMPYLDTSAVAPRLEQLGLSSSPIGGRGLAGLGRYERLARLELRYIDLHDGDLPAKRPTTAITELDIAHNQLGRAGIEWFVAAAPRLRKIELAGIHADALAPLASAAELSTVELALLDRATIIAFVDEIVPRLAKLSRLRIPASHTADLVERLPRDLRLASFALGPVTVADIDALARRPGSIALESLSVGDGFDNTCARVLAASPQLANLRELSISSRELGETGIARLLAGKWPLETLHLAHARIEDVAELEPPTGRPFVLALSSCDIAKPKLDRLQRAFGARLRAS